MAASEIRAGRAYIQLTAKDKLTKGLQNAKKKLQTFGSSVSAIGKKMVGIGAVVGGALTATAAYFMQVGDKFDKMSGRTGASVQWLSQMAFAAQQSGTSIQAVQDAVKQMNKRFGQAQRGQGEMLKGLEMLGMSTKQLQKLAPQQMFETLSDEIAKVTDQAKRTKIIDAMFGGGGNQLQNLIGRMESLDGVFEKLQKQKISIETDIEQPQVKQIENQTYTISADIEPVQIDDVKGKTVQIKTETAEKSDKVKQIKTKADTTPIEYMEKQLAELSDTEIKAKFNVDTKSLKGLDQKEKFKVLAKSISSIEDSTQRAKKSIELFGVDISKMTTSSISNIQKLKAQADKLGLTISTQDAKNAAELSDAWGRLVAMAKMMVFQIGGALAPALKQIADQIKIVGTAVMNWVKQNRSTFATIAKITVAVIAVGGALVVLGGIISGFGAVLGGISTVISVFGTVLGAILSPVGLCIAAVVGLGAVIADQTGAMGQAVQYLSGTWGKLKDYMGETWQGVKDAFQGGDLKLAVKILWLSVKAAWLQGIRPLTETWIGFKALLSDGWTNLWYGMADVFSACFYALKDGWSATVYWLLDAFNATVNGLTVAWNAVTGFLTEAWSSTVNGIAKIWNKVMGTLMKAWVKLKGLFSDKVNVDVQVSRIDNEINAKNSALDDETASVVRKNQQRAQAQRQAREREKQATQQARNAERQENQRARNADRQRYEKQRQAELQANQNYYADQMGEANAAIERAKAERKALLKQAKQKAEQARERKKQETERRKQSAVSSIGEVKGSVKGSFYADAINGVKTNNDTKRTADGVQQLVTETRRTNDLLKKNSSSNGGTLVFG